MLSYEYDISYVARKISDRNFCGMPFFADFPANFFKFQIFAKRSIFVVKKHLLYEIAFNFIKENDDIILKWFA